MAIEKTRVLIATAHCCVCGKAIFHGSWCYTNDFNYLSCESCYANNTKEDKHEASNI